MASVDEEQLRRQEWLSEWKHDNRDSIIMSGVHCMPSLVQDAMEAEAKYWRATTERWHALVAELEAELALARGTRNESIPSGWSVTEFAGHVALQRAQQAPEGGRRLSGVWWSERDGEVAISESLDKNLSGDAYYTPTEVEAMAWVVTRK